MRRYRMGLIQTPEQLRFSYLAIMDGAKSLRLTMPNGTAAADKQVADEEAAVRQRKAVTGEESQVKETSPANNNSAQERERLRQERKRKTDEMIQRIKEKTKELDQRSKFKSKMLKLGLIGGAVLLGAGLLYYAYFWSGAAPAPVLPHRSLQNLSFGLPL